MRREKLYKSCMNKSLLKNKKGLPKLFITLNTVCSSTNIELFHFEYGENHQNKSIEICLYNFCRAFHDASFKRKIKILSFSQAAIYAK